MSVYNEIVGITKDYLGPSAERFIARQVSSHLKKNPDEITSSDVEKLTEWIRVSISLLTEDSKMVDECIARITKLT